MNKVRLKDLYNKKKNNEKAVLITAYDFSSAKTIDECDVDIILMGDSAAMVMLGYQSTIEVTLDEIIVLSKAVRRGVSRAYYIVDMPFLSYQPSAEDAIRNCGRVLKETGCDSVKMEGGLEHIDIIRAVMDCGIPVCGHLGMLPQRYRDYGGYPVIGKDAEHAEYIIKSAEALQETGIKMLIVESIPSEITKYLRETLHIPVYAIGSGTDADGQIIVLHDILGAYPVFKPRFIKQYDNFIERMSKAVNAYAKDVKAGHFPPRKSIPKMNPGEFKKLSKKIK